MVDTYGFSKQEMLTELREILLSEARIANRFFNPQTANVMFGLDLQQDDALPEDIDISHLHITRVFSLLYDLVMNSEWDYFGGMMHPSDFRSEAKGFIERAIDAEQLEIGTGTTDIEGGPCEYIANAASGRIKLSDEHQTHDLGPEEIAALAHIDIRTVRNASRDLGIKDGQISIEKASEWLVSRKMYRPTRMFDSIDEMDPTNFIRLVDFIEFVDKRCKERGIDEMIFVDRIGWGLYDITPRCVEGCEGLYINISTLTIEHWVEIAKLIEVDHVWLMTRLLHTSELFVSFCFKNWYQNTVWKLWDAHQARRKKGGVLVPVASDGSFFHAGLQRRGGFLVGGKKDKHYIRDFNSALEELKRMEHAYWHRPNPNTGLWGVVKALSWKEMPEEQVMNGQIHPVEK